MHDIDCKSAAKTTDVKAAMTGFLSEFKNFQTDIQTKLMEQESRLTMMQTKSARPALSAAAEVEVPHQKAFAAYLRSGDDDGLRALGV